MAAFALILPLAAILRPALALSIGPAAGPGSEDRWPVLGISMVHVGMWVALLGAVRLRHAPAATRRPVRHEIVSAVVLVFAVWAGAAPAHVTGAAWAAASTSQTPADDLMFARSAPFFGGVSAAAASVGYLVFWSLALAWPAWDRLRRTRLRWALTHGQFVGSLALVVVAAVLMTAFARGVLTWLATRMLPAVTTFTLLAI